MSDLTKIQWTDATWNPWHGCHKISPGCKACYMFRDKKRYGQNPNVVVRSATTFNAPLKWTKPQFVFTCSWSDWFIEEADPWREEAYAIMRRTPHLTYQVLTKRIERAAGRLPNPMLPNMWLGVSVENQQYADERIPLLLQAPAALRFISAEPLLGPLDLTQCGATGMEFCGAGINCERMVDWVIVGGESGPNARSCYLDWIISIVRQCTEVDMPCFVKQLGAKCVAGHSLHRQIHHRSTDGNLYLHLKDSKGGDINEWPPQACVRQMPALAGVPV